MPVGEDRQQAKLVVKDIVYQKIRVTGEMRQGRSGRV